MHLRLRSGSNHVKGAPRGTKTAKGIAATRTKSKGFDALAKKAVS